MGFFSKIFKGVKKVFKKIGSGIKKVALKIGKVVDKLGIVGQIGLMFILPGIGGALAKGFGAVTSSLLGGSLGAIGQGVGHVLATAGKFASTVGNAFSSVTKGISSFVQNVGGKVLEKVGLKAVTEGTLTEAFQTWMSDTATDFGKILDPFAKTSEEFAKSLVAKPTAGTASKTAEEVSIAETDAAKAVESTSKGMKGSTTYMEAPPEIKTGELMNLETNVREQAIRSVSEDIAVEQAAGGNTLKDFITQDQEFLGKTFNIADEARNQAIGMAKNALFAPEETEEEYASRVTPFLSDYEGIQRNQDLYQQNGVYIGATPVNRVASTYGQYLQQGTQQLSPIRRTGG